MPSKFTSTLWLVITVTLLPCVLCEFLNTTIRTTTKEDSEQRIFPKCCPDNFVYNTKEKHCVESKNGVSNKIMLLTRSEIPFGKDCEVVTENIFEDFEFYNKLVLENTNLIYKNESFPLGRYCVDFTVAKIYIVKLCHRRDFCKVGQNRMCLKKCCPDGHAFVNATCTYAPMVSFDVAQVSHIFVNSTLEDYVATRHERKTCSRYIANKNNSLTIKSDGSVIVNDTNVLKEYTIDEEMYCVENVRNNQAKKGRMIVLLCTRTNEDRFAISKYLMAFSCICHFLTIYFFFQCRKIIQKAITSFCIAQTISFTILSILQFKPNHSVGSVWCSIAVYSHLYFSLAAILWLNVIAFEICRTLRSMEQIQSNSRTFFDKLTIRYSLYAWGLAALITIFYSLDILFHILPRKVHPDLGRRRCILENHVKDGYYSYAIYFLLPMALVIVINTYLYYLTIKYYIEAKSVLRGFTDSSSHHGRRRPMNHSVKFYGDMLHMVLKLFAIMGCTWIFEIVFSVYDFKQNEALRRIEITFDTVNSLQGFIIYVIFVGNKHFCRKVRALRGFTKRYFSSSGESFDTTTTITTRL